MSRLPGVLALVVAVAVATMAPAAAAHHRPVEYVVSDQPGVLPEGIAIQRDGTMYVTSDATGALFRGDVDDPEMQPFDASGATDRGTSLGVHTDRAGRIWSVGGDTLTVHGRSGRLLTTRTAAGGPLGPADLNDLVLTPHAVYVTDWANPFVYRAQVHGTRVGALQPWLDVRPAFPGFPAEFWLLNGIVADPSGRTLLVASNGTEAVWRVDTATGDMAQLDLGEQSFGADGMVLAGRRLYAVLNYGAPPGVYVARLDRGLRSGRVTHEILTDATGQPFDLPTTLARHDGRIYVVNSQNDEPPGTPPYTVSAVRDPVCGGQSPRPARHAATSPPSEGRW